MPSLTEPGYKDFEAYGWIGLFAPAGSAMEKILETPEVKVNTAFLAKKTGLSGVPAEARWSIDTLGRMLSILVSLLLLGLLLVFVAKMRGEIFGRLKMLAILPEVTFDDVIGVAEAKSSLLGIVAVFSARLYGSRSRKNQKLLDSVKQAVEDSRS